MKLFLSDW